MERAGNLQIVEAESDFKKVHKSIIKNKDIDCQTLGIYVKILVLGKEWNLNINGLSSHLGLSDTKIRTSIKLLESFGYVTRHAVKGDNGKFIGWDYKIYSIPVSEKTQAGLRTCQKSDTPCFGQDGERTTPFADNTENREESNSRPKVIIDLNNNKTKEEEEEEKQDWEKDFNAYYQLVIQAQHQLLYDAKCKAEKEKYHPNLDYELSLEKMVNDYWGTEKAWEHKKKSKSKKINMVTTLKKAFDVSSNRVYKRMQFGKIAQREVKEQIPQNKNYTRVPLHPELKFIDDDGKLNDGTYVKDGYRYYFSKRDCTTYSVPPATEPKPIGDGYEYDGNYGWYFNE